RYGTRTTNPGGAAQRRRKHLWAAAQIVAHRLDKVKSRHDERRGPVAAARTDQAAVAPPTWAKSFFDKNGIKIPVLWQSSGNGLAASELSAGSIDDRRGVGEGRHVDFAVYARVWSGGLPERCSRDGGTPTASTP